jgi:hypothetical protein
MFAGVERPVGGDPVDGDEGAVDHHERMPGGLSCPQRGASMII